MLQSYLRNKKLLPDVAPAPKKDKHGFKLGWTYGFVIVYFKACNRNGVVLLLDYLILFTHTYMGIK